MSGESQSEFISTTTRACTSCDDSCIFDSLPVKGVSVIETLLINEESQQFYRWLGTILLYRGHVYIINEDGKLFPRWSSVYTFTLSLNLVLNGLLSPDGGGLSGEVQENRVDVFRLLNRSQLVQDDD